jgi:hypothetical protein
MARAPCLPAVRRAGRLARRGGFVPCAGLFAWAVVTMTGSDFNVPTSLPTTTIIDSGRTASRAPI